MANGAWGHTYPPRKGIETESDSMPQSLCCGHATVPVPVPFAPASVELALSFASVDLTLAPVFVLSTLGPVDLDLELASASVDLAPLLSLLLLHPLLLTLYPCLILFLSQSFVFRLFHRTLSYPTWGSLWHERQPHRSTP